jgi:hypothetical protein
MAGGIEFNRGKFKELVLYLSQVSEREGDEGFGMVKLNKLLYHADFEAYRLLGRSITGATYERQEWGPVARHLPIILDELAAAGRMHWEFIPRGEHVRKVPTVEADETATPDTTMFSDDERRVIEDTLRALATYGGKAASDWSHEKSAGWNAVKEDGREITYETAFVSTDPIPPEDLERASHYVRERGWVKGTV